MDTFEVTWIPVPKTHETSTAGQITKPGSSKADEGKTQFDVIFIVGATIAGTVLLFAIMAAVFIDRRRRKCRHQQKIAAQQRPLPPLPGTDSCTTGNQDTSERMVATTTSHTLFPILAPVNGFNDENAFYEQIDDGGYETPLVSLKSNHYYKTIPGCKDNSNQCNINDDIVYVDNVQYIKIENNLLPS